MKNSDHITRPDAPVPEAHIHRMDPQPTHSLIKTAVRTDFDWVTNSPHRRFAPRQRTRLFDGGMPHAPVHENDTAVIVHYSKRSWEEFQEKVAVGRPSVVNPLDESSLDSLVDKANDGNRNWYMKNSANGRVVWTDFRDVWRRIGAELSNNDVGVAVWHNGRRCRILLRGGPNGQGELRRVSEVCTQGK